MRRLAEAFLDLGSDPESRRALAAHDLDRFVPVTEALYEGERQALLGRAAALGGGRGFALESVGAWPVAVRG